MRLLKEHYKTWEGASKRARFENGVARFEFEQGYKAKHYRYTVVDVTDINGIVVWRVARNLAVS